MNTEFENMALLNIEDYNELKAKAEATDEQIKKQAEEMAKPEVVTLKVCFDTYGLLYRPNTCVDVEIPFYDAFKIESRFLTGSYEQFWIIKESVCPAIKGEAGYSKEEFDKVNKENQDSELESINSFNNTLKNANEIKDRVLKYVYNIKQERSYNNDLVGIFERYKDIADGDMEVAMNFIKEAYPFNEETESFIRKKFDMPIPDESKEQ